MASMSTANRIEVPAANVSSRVSTYMPPCSMEGESLRPWRPETATGRHFRRSVPVRPCPTRSGPSVRTQ